jgi:hypothetical protein
MDNLSVLPGQVAVKVPVIGGRPDGNHPIDSCGARPPEEVRQAAGPRDGIKMSVGVDERH